MSNSTARRRIAAGLLTALALTGSALVAEPASAATTTSVVYSTDGGATWTSSPTVAPGGTVLVRQWFDNTDDLHATSASETTTLPAGFSQTGATQVCLNPSTTTITSPDGTELACATANNGAVWSGSSLTVSPTAGLFGQSSSDTSGILAAGRKKYLNLGQCRWRNNTTSDLIISVAINNPNFAVATNVSNTALSAPSCTTALTGWTLDTTIRSMQTYDLFARRYVNLHQCRYENGDDNSVVWNAAASDTRYRASTNTSNTADSTEVCTPGPAGFPLDVQESGNEVFDTLTNRYLNVHQCLYNSTGNGRIPMLVDGNAGVFGSGSNASNTADTALVCSPAPATWTPGSSSAVEAFDLLDNTRGKGYVEYTMTAPATPSPTFCATTNPVTPEAFSQNTALTSSAGSVTDTGTVTVDWTQLTDACPGNVGNAVDPGVGILMAGTLALAGAGVATVRHRRTTLA